MLRTIKIGTVFVQGMFVRALGDGNVVISVGKRLYTGRPV